MHVRRRPRNVWRGEHLWKIARLCSLHSQWGQKVYKDLCCPNVLTLETPRIVSSPFVTTRPFSLRNNLVNRAVENLLKSFAGSYSTYKYFFFSSGDLNLNLNSPRIWLLTLFHIKHIFHSLNHEIYFSIRNSRHTMLPYSCHVTLIWPIRTPFAYEVVSQRKCPSNYEWYQDHHGSLCYTDLRRHIEPHWAISCIKYTI